MTDGELRLSVVSKNIRFLLCSLLYPEFLLPAAVWVVCCASESLIVALSFRHLMWGDCKDLLLQSPFFVCVCGVFKCCPPASKSKAFKICMSCQFQLQHRIQPNMVGKSLKGLENIQSKVQTFYLCLHTLSTRSVYKYNIVIHTRGFGSNEDIKISSDIFIQVAFAWERVIRMRFSLV